MKKKNLINYLRLPNLGLMLTVLFGVQFSLLPYLNLNSILNHLQFSLLAFSMLCLASYGNLQNDYVDVAIDAINQPKKSKFYATFGRKNLLRAYIFLGCLGVLISSLVCIKLSLHFHIFIFVTILGLLHVYNYFLKLSFLLGNICISLLIAYVVLLPFMFVDTANIELNYILWDIPLTYFIASFLFNFLREIVKDIIDRKGDYILGGKTLVLQIGISRCANVLLYFSFACIMVLVLAYYLYFPKNWLSFLGLLIHIIPSFFVGLELQKKEEKIKWHKISNLLKITLLLGSFSLYGFLT